MIKDKSKKLKISEVKFQNTLRKSYERFPAEGISQFFITKSSLFNNMEFIFDDWVELSEKNDQPAIFYTDKKDDVITYFTNTDLHENTCVVDYTNEKKCRKIFVIMSSWALSDFQKNWALSNFQKNNYLVEYFEKKENKSSTFLGDLITKNEKIILSDVLNYHEIDVPDGCHKVYGYDLSELDLSYGFCIEIDEI